MSLWRAIERMQKEERYTVDYLPLLRKLSASLEGTESFLRTAAGIEIFAERGLISVRMDEERITMRSLPGRKVDLEQSSYVLHLRGILRREEKGGR